MRLVADIEIDEKFRKEQLVYIDKDGKIFALEEDELVYIDKDGKIFPIESYFEYSWEEKPGADYGMDQ